MLSEAATYQKVSAVVVDALDAEDVKPTSTLCGDLGADSIDILYIIFRLEQEFGISIPSKELFAELILKKGDPDFVANGKVTAKGLQELRKRMPFADLSKLENQPDLTAISDLLTVEMFAKYIESRLSDNDGGHQRS